MNIIFYGTPEFAVESLKQILDNGLNVIAVVTTPDKPAGRGLKLRPSPVKEFALQNNLKVLEPKSLKDPEFVKTIEDLKPDVQVVVAFKILPPEIFTIPPKGTINLHASYLPQYRGAAPINWVIINGENETGITTFIIDKKVDTGKILLRKKIPIEPDETAGQLHDKLMVEGAKLLVETLKLIEKDQITPIPQEQLISDNEPLKKAPKLTNENLLNCF